MDENEGPTTAAPESTTFRLPLARVLSGASLGALLAVVTDLVLVLSTASDAAVAWRSPSLPRALFLSAAIGFVIVFACLLAASLRRWRNPRALVLAVLAGVASAHVELVLVRFRPFADERSAAWPSVILGLAVGVAVYALLARATARRFARTPWITIALAALLFGGLHLWREARGEQHRSLPAVSASHPVPRVFLIVADTLRADALELGPGESRTPRLRDFARQAWRFEEARAPSPWTLPSMTSLLTGISPLVHGATRRASSLPAEIPTLAEAFARAGYRTAAMGHNPVLTRNRRLDRGFQHFDFPSTAGLPGKSLGIALLAREREAEAMRFEDATELVEHAAAWVDDHAQEDLLLWMHFYDAHLAYVPPVDLLPDEGPPSGMGRAFAFRDLELVRAGYSVPDEAGRAWVRALYDAEVRHLDAELGRFFEHLQRRGLYDDALIVVTSDHGEEFWEHDGFEHGHTGYDELLRVPLLVKLPGQTAGGAVRGPVSIEGVAASLAQACDVVLPGPVAAALFDDQGAPRATDADRAHVATGTLYYEDRLVVVFEGWKYVLWRVTGREELFDLDADPGEERSLVHDAPERLEQARARLAAALEAARGERERLGVEASDGGMSAADEDALRKIGYAAK